MEVIGTVPVTPSARIGGLIVLTVACVAGAEAPVGAQPGHTGWTVSLVAGSLFGGDLETGEREPTYGGAVALGVGHGVSLEAEVAVIPEPRQFGDLELLIGTGSLLYHPFTASINSEAFNRANCMAAAASAAVSSPPYGFGSFGSLLDIPLLSRCLTYVSADRHGQGRPSHRLPRRPG